MIKQVLMRGVKSDVHLLFLQESVIQCLVLSIHGYVVDSINIMESKWSFSRTSCGLTGFLKLVSSCSSYVVSFFVSFDFRTKSKLFRKHLETWYTLVAIGIKEGL